MRQDKRFRRAGAVAAVLALALGACDGDDAGDDAAEAAATGDAAAPADDAADDDAADDAQAEAVTVTAVDYAYPDAPASITAGTTVVLQNDSEGEVHEILAFRIADDEERSVADLLAAGEAEFGAVAEMRGVALAPPGADSTGLPAPPMVLGQPGRYAFVCFIPTGAPPDEVMAAVEAYLAEGAPEDGAPQYPQTGPPHAANGMFAEVEVTA